MTIVTDGTDRTDGTKNDSNRHKKRRIHEDIDIDGSNPTNKYIKIDTNGDVNTNNNTSTIYDKLTQYQASVENMNMLLNTDGGEHTPPLSQ